VERTVWDGDQVLMEIRAPSDPGIPGVSNPESDTGGGGDQRFYGRVAYVHAGGIDQPLELVRMDVWQPSMSWWLPSRRCRDCWSNTLLIYGELLPHVFMGDVSRFVIRQYSEHREGLLGVLEPLFSTLERGATEGSEDVQEMIAVSFLENVAEEMTLFPDLRLFLGPTLKHELRGVLNGFGCP